MNHEITTGKTPRLHNIDTIRGFAVLGILLMNIQSFSMPEAAYVNPTAFGDLTGINLWVWVMTHHLADSKFMSIFSLLFGAGILLFLENLERKSENAMAVHRRRMTWLLLFGLVHAYFIWDGDILVTYAICGLIVTKFRHQSAQKLWRIGGIFLAVSVSIMLVLQLPVPFMTPEELAELNVDWLPDDTIIQAEIARMTGPWLPRFLYRSENSFFLQTFGIIFLLFWRVAGLMLIGMALYKQGLFRRSCVSKTFVVRALVLFALGITIIAYGVYFNFEQHWSIHYSLFFGSQLNAIGSILVALAYVYFLVIVIERGWLSTITRRLALVGRMAFSNYISQSVICTLLFYGSGLALFGQVERWQQLLIVLAIWALQIAWSSWYLQRFTQGPLEALWRRLTYR